MNQYDNWEDYHELAEQIREDLYDTEIPDRTVQENRIYTQRPKPDGVFTYPKSMYFETKDEYAEYADIIEGVVEEYAEIDRWDVTTRTDGKANKHYYVIQSVKE